jgi:hypothetical protein
VAVSLPARTAQLNVGFLSVGTTGMPLEMSGEVRVDISSRYTVSANGRKNEPPSGAPTTRPGWLQATPLFQAIGCSKTNLGARLKYSEICVTRHVAEKNARPRCSLLPKTASGGATALILHDHGIAPDLEQ